MEMLPFLISCSLNYRKRDAATHPFPKVNALQSSWPRLTMATVGVVWRLAKRKKTNTTQKNYFFLFFPSADENVHKPNAPWKKRQKSD